MSIPVAFDLESPGWLRNLRWAGICGMLLAVLGAHFLGANFHVNRIYILLSILAVWNLFLPVLENRFFATSKGFVFFQVLVDISVLLAILWHSGGLVNPFVSFFVLYVIIAGLLLNPKRTFFVSLFTSACVLILLKAPSIYIGTQELELRTSPIWFGLPLGLILLILITNGFILVYLKRLEEAQYQLRHRVKMDALGRLVAGLAHEIGTPLNSILVIAKDLETTVPEDHRKELSIIANQAKRCGEIVSLLLGYSRTFVRRSEDVQYKPIALRSWIQEIWQQLEEADQRRFPGHPGNQVSFEFKLVGVTESLAIPELILRQVLENLMKNSRDAIRDREARSILVEVSEDVGEEEIVFRVSDSGPGFSKEATERAFEAFFSTKKQGFGSGLGLYISYYLINQVGGRIVIEEGGAGARIIVGIPSIEAFQERVGTEYGFERFTGR
jgi:two-component system, sensor histidine kinase RegB